MPDWKKRYGIFCAVFLLLLLQTGFFLFTGKFQLCVFRMVTGLPCPGCGLTSATLSLLRGDWKQSLAYHPLLIPVIFTLAVIILQRYGLFRKLHRSRCFYFSVFGLLCVLYALRMTLYFPDGPYPMVYDSASLAGVIRKIAGF